MTGRDEERGAEKQDVLSEVNAHVHEAAKRFEGVEPSLDRWDFTCECGAPECRASASLTIAEYEELRAAGRPLLAPGHRSRA